MKLRNWRSQGRSRSSIESEISRVSPALKAACNACMTLPSSASWRSTRWLTCASVSRPERRGRKADLQLDLVADGLPARGDLGRLGEQRLGDEGFAFTLEALAFAAVLAECGFERDGERDGGDLADFGAGEEVVRLVEVVDDGAIDLAGADGEVTREQDVHDFLAQVREVPGRGQLLFERAVVDQYFHGVTGRIRKRERKCRHCRSCLASWRWSRWRRHCCCCR